MVKHVSEDDIMFTKVPVHQGLTGWNKIFFICLTRLYNKMIKLSELRNLKKKSWSQLTLGTPHKTIVLWHKIFTILR